MGWSLVDKPIVDRNYFWQPMDTYPGGCKALLLNKAGIAMVGKTTGKDSWIIAWCPLPKIPPELKDKLI